MTKKEKDAFRKKKPWLQFREEMWAIAQYRCLICDMKHKTGLHVHHLDPDDYTNLQPDKFVVLCSACHDLAERLISRTRNKINITNFCDNLKLVFLQSKKGGNDELKTPSKKNQLHPETEA